MANQTCNPSILTQALGISATGPRTVIVPADPIVWDEGTSYEYLTLVASADFGQGYVAKKDVPSGTPLTNTEYWVPVASFNAQLAQVQQDVAQIQQDVSEVTETASYIYDLSGKTVAFLGDSITIGTNHGEITTTFPQRFGEVTGATVSNFGVGGASAANIDVAPSTALKEAQALTSTYDYVFLMFGTNDYGYGSAAAVGNPLNTSEPNTTTTGGIRAAVSLVRSKMPLARVIGIIPPYMPGDNVKKDGKTARQIKAAIYQVYSDMNVPVIDLTMGLSIDASNWDAHLADWDKTDTRLHPNQATYIEIGEYVASCVAANSYANQTNDTTFYQPGQNVGMTPVDAAVVEDGTPPILYKNRVTNDWNIDFGAGFTLENDQQTLFTLPTNLNVYRDFYFSVVGYETSAPQNVHVMPCAITSSGSSETPSKIVKVGTCTTTGIKWLGSVVIPFAYVDTNYIYG